MSENSGSEAARRRFGSLRHPRRHHHRHRHHHDHHHRGVSGQRGRWRRTINPSFFRRLLDRLWIVALCLVGALIVTAALIERSPRTYVATAIVSLPPAQPGAAEPARGATDPWLSLAAKGLMSRAVLEQVVERNPAIKVPSRRSRAALSTDGAIAALRGMIDVRVPAGTRLIEVRVRNTNPAWCEHLANSVVREAIASPSWAAEWSDGVQLELVRQATVPKRPVSPKVARMLTWGLSAGVGVGLVLAWVVARHDNSKAGSVRRTADGLREPLAEPGLLSAGRRPPGSRLLPNLRRAMETMAHQEAPKTILFTSAVGGEGKTSCVLDYARSLASKGLKTALLDLDPDNSRLRRRLRAGLSAGPGAGGVLSGTRNLNQVIQEIPDEKLSYIAPGASTAELAECLAQGGFPEFTGAALRCFERLIVSAPPLLAPNGTRLLLPHVEAVCLVLRARKTSRRMAARAIHTVRKAGTPSRWIVLSRAAGVSLRKLAHGRAETQSRMAQ